MFSTSATTPHLHLPWLMPGEPFPATRTAWPETSPAPGLLAAGGVLDTATLTSAYAQGIFPWYSEGQPILWWSTSPRMLLRTSDFVFRHSLKKHIKSLMRQRRLEIRFNTAFGTVIRHCAHTCRPGQQGTWVTDDMMAAYDELHRCGHVHSVETWLDGRLAGGLYAVSIGRMVYGESMFSLVSNASKIALVGLVAHCIAHDMPVIDCQQETSHLASLGAHPVSREMFETLLTDLTSRPGASWEFDPVSLDYMLGQHQ